MTAICSKCGRDCKTALELGKHEDKCTVVPIEVAIDKPKHAFYDRHQQTGDKCPQCKETWSDFIILSETTWVCVKCGCQFMPKGKLTEINEWRLKHGEKWRDKAQDRICGQIEALDEVKGVREDATPQEAA